jgi:hypothetical protein
MTPLMQEILRDQCLPVAKRKAFLGSLPPEKLTNTHCFEMSSVREMMGDLAIDLGRAVDADPQSIERLAFLPAPRTWIEWHEISGRRIAWHLEADDAEDAAVCTIFTNASGHVAVEHWEIVPPYAIPAGKLPLRGHSGLGRYSLDFVVGDSGLSEWKKYELYTATTLVVYAALAMINSPRIIGRRQYMSHRGLQRQLIASKSLVGKFPLRAWTEIKLEVAPPRNEFGEPSKEAHLTGDRALHFCRAHLRVRLGKLEYVSAHWRGDASLGIKQSRYKLTKPRRAA